MRHKELPEKVAEVYESLPCGVIVIREGKLAYQNKQFLSMTAANSDMTDKIVEAVGVYATAGAEERKYYCVKEELNFCFSKCEPSSVDGDAYLVTPFTAEDTRFWEKGIGSTMREPLSVLITTVQSLFDFVGGRDKKIDRYLANLLQSGNRLLRLSGHLSETENASEPPVFRQFDIASYLRDMTKAVVDQMEQTGASDIPISFSCDRGAHLFCGDRDKIGMLYLNLLSNSLRYTREGNRISVRLAVKGDSVSLTVNDRGVGMDDEKLNAVFNKTELFARDGKCRIGLQLVRQIVAQHGGVFILTSTEGQGTGVVATLFNQQDNTQSQNRLLCDDYAEGYNLIRLELCDVLPAMCYLL